MHKADRLKVYRVAADGKLGLSMIEYPPSQLQVRFDNHSQMKRYRKRYR